MRHYPEEHRKVVVSKLIESDLSLRQFSHREGISLSTLYGWREKDAEADFSLTKSSVPGDWSAEQKFSTVIETAAMSEVELKRKDTALAETAALLVLRKKLNAYWGEDEDN